MFLSEWNNQLNWNIKQQQLSESERTDQIKWELLKYKVRKFAITYSKKLSQNTRRTQCELEKKLKEFESDLNSEANFNEYTKCEKNLELIYERIAQGVKIRSKCRWCKEGEKSAKFFLHLEKKWPVKALVRKLEVNGKKFVIKQK